MVLNCNGHTKTLHCGHQIVQLILILNKMIRDIGEQWFCFYFLISKEDEKMNEDSLIIESKNGPYYGPEKDRVRIETK